MPHAEIIHSWFSYNVMDLNAPSFAGKELADRYERLSSDFFKNGDVSVIPQLNVACCEVLAAFKEMYCEGFPMKDVASETITEIQRLATRPVKAFKATLAEGFADAVTLAKKKDDQRDVFDALMVMVMKIGDMVEDGICEDAVGNLLALFATLAETKVLHPEWFGHMLCAGDMDDLEFLTDATVQLYCHLRQREELTEDFCEDMDGCLLMNRKTGFFGDWSCSIYTDMLCAKEYQSEDYSDIEKLDVWNELKVEV